jgi:transcriptional regulator with XRE-family HTH domain
MESIMSATENPIDDLPPEAAVRQVSVMIPMDGPIPARKLDEVRTAVREYIVSRGYSQTKVARKLGTNPTYLSNFLSGSAALPPDAEQKLARSLNEWMERDYARRLTRAPEGYVPTRVAQRISKVADQVCATGDIGVIVGPAGIGKTTTLMLDQADDLAADTLKVVMDLHDIAGIPILLAGTHRLLRKLDHDRDVLRGQMSSRVGIRADVLRERSNPRGRGRPVEWIKAEQIRALFESPRIKLHPAAVAKLKDIANLHIGSLRRCARIVRYAQLLVPGAETADSVLITLEALDQATILVDGQLLVAGPPPPPPDDAELQEVSA